MTWRCQSILCFHYCFCLETTVYEINWMWTTSVAVMVIFFLKVSFPNYLITASFKAHFQQLWGALTTAVDNGNLIWKTLTTAFERHLTIQDFTDMDQQMSSLHQYIWLIIVCFSFSQTNPVFKFNLMLIEKFSSQPIYLSTLRDSVNLKFIQYFYEPVKFWWSSMLLNCEGLYRFVKAIFLFSIKY